MKFTEKNFPGKMQAMFEELKPILKKYNALSNDAPVKIKTGTFEAQFAPSCVGNGDPLCHIQMVHEFDPTTGTGVFVQECICPGDPRYIPNP